MSFLEQDEYEEAEGREQARAWKRFRAIRRMEYRMELVGLCVLLVGLAFVYIYQHWPSDADEQWTERPHRFVETDVRLAAAEFQAQVPKAIDRRTSLTAATSDRREVALTLYVNDSFEPVELARVRPQMEAATRAAACADPRTRSIIDRGGRFSWHYDFGSRQQFTYRLSSCV